MTLVGLVVLGIVERYFYSCDFDFVVLLIADDKLSFFSFFGNFFQ